MAEELDNLEKRAEYDRRRRQEFEAQYRADMGFAPDQALSGVDMAKMRNRIQQKMTNPADISMFDVLRAQEAGAAGSFVPPGGVAPTSRSGSSARLRQLQSQLTGAYDQSTKDIDQAYSSLEALLRGQANPYAGFVAQEAPVSGGLAELLGSQGVSNLPVQQLGAALQAQNTGQATAFQNLVNTLGQIYGASQQGALADVGRMRTESRRNAATNRQELLRMLIRALRGG